MVYNIDQLSFLCSNLETGVEANISLHRIIVHAVIEFEAGAIAKLQPGSNDLTDMLLSTRAILTEVSNEMEVSGGANMLLALKGETHHITGKGGLAGDNRSELPEHRRIPQAIVCGLTSSLIGKKCRQHYLLKFPPGSHFFSPVFPLQKTVVIIHPVNTFQLSPRL